MKYPDVVRLTTVEVDMYGDRTVASLEDIAASFVKRAAVVHGENTEGEVSDAAVYLIPTNATVLAKRDDLEGMYILSEPFSDSNWYRIRTVSVAQRKLLNNTIDNIYCRLEKVAGLAYGHIS